MTIYSSNFIEHIQYWNYQFYADDTQLYISFPASHINETEVKLNMVLKSLISSAKSRSLYIIAKKSSLVEFGPNPNNLTVTIDKETIHPVNETRN